MNEGSSQLSFADHFETLGLRGRARQILFASRATLALRTRGEPTQSGLLTSLTSAVDALNKAQREQAETDRLAALAAQWK